MKLRGHIIQVLLKKDMKMMLKNKNFMTLLIVPLGFAFLFKTLYGNNDTGMSDSFLLTMCTVFNILMIPLSGLAIMVAEEKEKNTLRVLMLHDVSGLEYVLSKTISVLFMMEIVSVAMFFITDLALTLLFPYIVISSIVSLVMLLLGATFGLMFKDQMTASTMTVPIMIVFMLPPFFSEFNEILHILSYIIPTAGMQNILVTLFDQGIVFQTDLLMQWVVILLWIVLCMVAFLVIYRKKGVDN